MKTYYPIADYLKFIMALVVVEIHSLNIGNVPIFSVLNSIAVPVFFILSSFFFFRKTKNNTSFKILYDFEKRVIILYLFWIVFNFPLVYFSKSYIQVPTIYTPLYFIKDFFLGYLYPSSWFLGALIIGTPIVFILVKYTDDKFSWIIPLLLYLYISSINFLPDTWRKPYIWYSDNIRDPHFSFVSSIFWIYTGYFLFKLQNSDIFRDMPCKTMIVSILISGGACYIIPMVGHAALAITLVIMALTKTSHQSSPLCARLRTYSIWFYCMHMSVIKILGQVYQFSITNYEWLNNLIYYLLIILVLTTISTIMYKIKGYKYFCWLKYSY